MKLKTVVISLPFDIERRSFMQETLKKCNLSDYIIIDGVNGNDIKIIPFIEEPHMSKLIYNNTEKIYNSRLRLNGTGLKKGEMGCSWSHLNVYDMLVKDDNYDAYLILEDDADLIVSPEELETFLEELKTLSFDLCHIFQSEWYDFNRIKQISNNFWIPERRFFNNTGAYIITKTGSKKLLEYACPEIGLPSDDLISNLYVHSLDFNLIVSSKFLFKPKGLESSIHKVNNLPDKQKLISIKDFGIWARLGNQMFQYAYLRSLSIEKGFKINLPIYASGHQYKTSQFFDCFDIDVVDTTDIVEDFVTISETSMMYQDKFASENIDMNQNIMFEGCFQCEKYFEKYKDIIRSDFTFKENIRNVGDIFMSQFDNNRKQVALHVRRADNLSSVSPTILVSETFRLNAINYLLKNNVTDFDILIFSDDKEWCKSNLNYTSDNISQTIVDGLSDLEELYVMSLCDHFIIGSSSYSWWAAWLSQSEDKIVMVPDKWFTNKLYNEIPLCDQEKDLYVNSWIKLSLDYPEEIKSMNLVSMYDTFSNKLKIPDNITHIKIDIGLSYNSPNSRHWVNYLENRFVFGFEPNKDSISSALKGNYNGIIFFTDLRIGTHFQLIPCAIDIEENKLTFYNTVNDVGYSSLYKPVDETWIGSSYKVECFQLKTFFKYFPWDIYPYIEHIKIDTKGNDLRVLKSMENYIEKVAYITPEIDDSRFQYNCDKKDSGYTFDDINIYMINNGFKLIPSNVVGLGLTTEGDQTYVNTRFSDELLKTLDYTTVR